MSDSALLKRRLERSACGVLACGVIVSAATYLTAPMAEQNSLVEGFRGSKAYRHELEAYGGKLSLVSDELTRWFASLWQGEALAFTVGAISIAIALLLFWFARLLSVPLPVRADKLADPVSKG